MWQYAFFWQRISDQWFPTCVLCCHFWPTFAVGISAISSQFSFLELDKSLYRLWSTSGPNFCDQAGRKAPAFAIDWFCGRPHLMPTPHQCEKSVIIVYWCKKKKTTHPSLFHTCTLSTSRFFLETRKIYTWGGAALCRLCQDRPRELHCCNCCPHSTARASATKQWAVFS